MLDRGEVLLGDLLSCHAAATHEPPNTSRCPIRFFLSSCMPDWGVMGPHGEDPRKNLPEYWQRKGPVDDLDEVLVLPFWQGGPKRIEILSGVIPAGSIGKSDIEPIARAASIVLAVPFDSQRRSDSRVCRLLDTSMAHIRAYNAWFQPETRGDAGATREGKSTKDQAFLPLASALEMGKKGKVKTTPTTRRSVEDWEAILRFQGSDSGVPNVDSKEHIRLAVLHNGEVVAVPANSTFGDEVFTTFVSPANRPGLKQWVACVGRPVSGFEATNEGIACYAKQQLFGPLRDALDSGKTDGKSIPGSDWASLGPFADKAPTLKRVQADIALPDNMFDIHHYSVIGVAVDASARHSLHARASSHYVAIH